jgi:uncharacterized protein YecE (DUF72 family)
VETGETVDNSPASTIRIGCSGWNYASWRQELYEGLPPRLWLEHYARHFDTVEVNNTFYRLPRREAVANWERTVPPGFLFTVKVSRYLTHVKRLLDVGAGLAAACEQLPSWQRHCFGFRHPSWFADDVYALLRKHGVALVIGDRPEVKAFQAHVFTASWTLVRFHYGSRGRRGNYSETELREWASRFEAWRKEVGILAYFNNDWEVFAVRNALRLKELLGSGRIR